MASTRLRAVPAALSRGLRSIRFRAAAAAAVAAAVVFGLGWLWIRHTVDIGHRTAAIGAARADAITIGSAAFPGGSTTAITTADTPLYLSTWVAVLDTGEIICGGSPGVDDFLRAGQLTLPVFGPDWTEHETVTAQLGQLPGGRLHPLAGRSVTLVGAPADAERWRSKVGPLAAARHLTDPPRPKDGAGTVDPDGKLSPPIQRQPVRAVVYVLANTEEAERAVAAVDSSLGRGLPVAVLFVALVAWFVTGRALRPVERIRARLAEVSTRRLGERVPVPRSADELSRLAVTMNATLDRLEDAVNQQRRFVADAAHELRSPVASLRGSLEVGLAHPDRADWPEVVATGLRNTRRLESLTDDLLLLARLDRAQAGAQLVDLAALAEEQVAERAYLRPARPACTVHTSGDTRVAGNPIHLGRLLSNLLDNAARHAATEVTVTIEPDPPGHLRLTVADDGPGIPAADRDRVFDRFTRLDEARSRDAGGTGLGLAIARDIATSHGGTLTVGDAPRGTRLVARLPTPAGPAAVPGDGRVAPGDGWVAPADGWVAPGDGWVAPGDGWVAPGDDRVAPADGAIDPGDDSISSNADR